MLTRTFSKYVLSYLFKAHVGCQSENQTQKTDRLCHLLSDVAEEGGWWLYLHRRGEEQMARSADRDRTNFSGAMLHAGGLCHHLSEMILRLWW